MTCPRCDGLLVHEYLLNPREGSLSGFHGSLRLNCGAIHGDGELGDFLVRYTAAQEQDA